MLNPPIAPTAVYAARRIRRRPPQQRWWLSRKPPHLGHVAIEATIIAVVAGGFQTVANADTTDARRDSLPDPSGRAGHRRGRGVPANAGHGRPAACRAVVRRAHPSFIGA